MLAASNADLFPAMRQLNHSPLAGTFLGVVCIVAPPLAESEARTTMTCATLP